MTKMTQRGVSLVAFAIGCCLRRTVAVRAELFRAERHQRIDAGRAPRRKIARQQG